MTMQSKPTSTISHVKANEGEHFLAGSDVVTIKLSSQNTADPMLVVDVRVPVGGGPPAIHRNPATKVFYFLEGVFNITTVTADNQQKTTRAEAGDFVAIPTMAWHNIKNVGDATGRYIGIHSPGQMEPFLREIGQPISDPLNPPQPKAPASHEEQHRLMALVQDYMEIFPAEQLR
ncbi:cupin domain-containing protein [Dyadobacter sp. CY326]|uniref:cupin domain-containing protein n=1 Tax=Dyadobacter sp. CY326 TaxID=2907300 RepID=UPI001F20118A|nr:cupin domain-containing protein [Dyadobacter sp. CY326]MCE7067133.1 cupin domain-containing protein [Dyadobacter sp. CY326]